MRTRDPSRRILWGGAPHDEVSCPARRPATSVVAQHQKACSADLKNVFAPIAGDLDESPPTVATREIYLDLSSSARSARDRRNALGPIGFAQSPPGQACRNLTTLSKPEKYSWT